MEQNNRAGPTEYTPELGVEIVACLSEGGTILELSKRDGMPSRAAIYRWAEKHADFREALTRARLAQAHFYFEKMMSIAFDASGDIFIDGDKTVANHANVQRARLQIDTLKFAASKLLPKTYGERPEGETLPSAGITRLERVIIGAADAPKAPEPPRQIEFMPPQPGELNPDQWALLRQVLDLIDRAVGVRPPGEVFGVLKSALLEHFGSNDGCSDAA